MNISSERRKKNFFTKYQTCSRCFCVVRHWTNGVFRFYLFCISQEVPDENYDLPYHQNDTNGDAVMIKMDVPGREEPSYPKEKWKTFIGEFRLFTQCSVFKLHHRSLNLQPNGWTNSSLDFFPLFVLTNFVFFLSIRQSLAAFVIFAANMTLATVSLSLVHERLPDRETYGPLPDIFLDNVLPQSWALDVSEILIMVQVNCCILLITFHKHRWVNGVWRTSYSIDYSHNFVFYFYADSLWCDVSFWSCQFYISYDRLRCTWPFCPYRVKHIIVVQNRMPPPYLSLSNMRSNWCLVLDYRSMASTHIAVITFTVDTQSCWWWAI